MFSNFHKPKHCNAKKILIYNRFFFLSFSSSAYASPNSIRKLVHGADQLVFIQNPSVDDSDVDYRPASEAEKPLKTKRSHSFHGSKSDVLLTSEDEMECDYNSHNASLKDADR